MAINYWCKQCRTYVLDTPLGKKQHESSPKHQNNVSRTLRNLQWEKDKESKERAQVERTLSQIDRQLGATPSSHSKPSTTRTTKRTISKEYVPPPLPASPPPEAAASPGAWTTVNSGESTSQSKSSALSTNNKRTLHDAREDKVVVQKKIKSTDSVAVRREARDEFQQWMPQEKTHQAELEEPSFEGSLLPSKFSLKTESKKDDQPSESDKLADNSTSSTPVFKRRLGATKAKKRSAI